MFIVFEPFLKISSELQNLLRNQKRRAPVNPERRQFRSFRRMASSATSRSALERRLEMDVFFCFFNDICFFSMFFYLLFFVYLMFCFLFQMFVFFDFVFFCFLRCFFFFFLCFCGFDMFFFVFDVFLFSPTCFDVFPCVFSLLFFFSIFARFSYSMFFIFS